MIEEIKQELLDERMNRDRLLVEIERLEYRQAWLEHEFELLVEQRDKLQADNAQLRAALAWAHDAIWTAHSKRETQTLDNWLNRRAGRNDMFVGFTEALDNALADYDRNKDPVVQLTEEVDQLRAALDSIVHTSSRTAIYKIAKDALKGKD